MHLFYSNSISLANNRCYVDVDTYDLFCVQRLDSSRTGLCDLSESAFMSINQHQRKLSPRRYL